MSTHPEQVERSAPYVIEIAREAPGARFLRADLQVHTPVDPRFKPPCRSSDHAARAEASRSYLQAALDRGIELVGITEHNDVSWLDELRYAAQGVGMQVLPGFEVESKEGVHVLCLFDPQTPTADLDECLARLGLTGDRRRTSKLQQLRADCSFPDLLELIQDGCGGICIAAHIDSDKGLMKAVGGGARADFWKSPQLYAVQIPRAPDELPPALENIVANNDPNYRRERPIAGLLTSDSRSAEEIGASSTWIKMDTVGVEGLRQAFLAPDSRIAYADPAQRRRGARLLAIAWEGGFLSDAAFPLNAELNCLIGGRGAGKSTVIESVRLAFDIEEPRPDDVRASVAALREGALRSGTKISILVEIGQPAPKRFIVERTLPHAPIVRDELGNALPDITPQQLFVPAVYGQKEVYGIAQSAQARLSLVDAFARESLRQPLERERAALSACERNAALILDLQRRIDDAQSKLGELPGLQQWRQRFKEAGFEEKLHERRQLDREHQALSQLDEGIRERRALLQRMRAEEAPVPPSPSPELPNQDLLARAAAVVDELATAWRGAVDDLGGRIATAQAALAEVRREWESRRAARAAEFDRALRDLQARMPDVDPERYLDVERRIDQLAPLSGVVDQQRRELQAAREQRKTLVIDLDDARGAKHRVRAQAAERMTAVTGGSVRLELMFQADREGYVSQLADLRTGARADALRRLVEHAQFSPREFVQAVRDRRLHQRFGIPEGQAALLERELDEATLMRLETLELCDRVTVMLDVGIGTAHDYKPLERLSPGQKSTAILLMLMRSSHEPLLIDQPEDDLDNRFIYDDVVQRLLIAKRERQFVVATHNANIPVLGDAEQIVVLDARERPGEPVRGEVQARGALDRAEVRTAAELILEGGEEAFARRREKYGW